MHLVYFQSWRWLIIYHGLPHANSVPRYGVVASTIDDFASIDLGKVTHYIDNLKIVGDFLVADIVVLNTPFGKLLTEHLEAGGDVKFGPRCLVAHKDGAQIVQHIITIDAIL